MRLIIRVLQTKRCLVDGACVRAPATLLLVRGGDRKIRSFEHAKKKTATISPDNTIEFATVSHKVTAVYQHPNPRGIFFGQARSFS